MRYKEVIKCHSCSDLYDVTRLNVDDEFKCTGCGATCFVPEVVTRMPTSVSISINCEGRSSRSRRSDSHPIVEGLGTIGEGLGAMWEGIRPW
jgi:hypothetical protein